MRGHDEQTTHMFSYLSPEQRVPADHPLRAVRALTDEALQTMSRRFASLYATTGRPAIPPGCDDRHGPPSFLRRRSMKHRWLGPWRASFDSCTNATQPIEDRTAGSPSPMSVPTCRWDSSFIETGGPAGAVPFEASTCDHF